MQTLPAADAPQRYYELILQKDLLGGWSVVRQYGRMGARGTLKKEHFGEREAAQNALMGYRDRQIKRGFKQMFVHAGGHRH